MLATPELIAAAAQTGRLAEALPRYRQSIPLYRQSPWPDEAVGRISPALWNKLPMITKADIRRGFPGNFLGPDSQLDDLLERDLVELEHTSGTSQDRTPLLLPRGWWAEQEQRALKLNSLVAEVLNREEQVRRITISSPVCSSDICYTGVPSRNERIIGSALHLSLSRFPFLWSEAELDRMVAEALEWRPGFLDVDPVYGVVFARHCERRGVRLPGLEFVLCSYEFLSVVHRRVLERAFGVPVFNLYGSTETGHLLMEDEQGRLRPSLETAFLELVNPDGNGVGDLVVTTLTNEFMPLIRYRIGDLATACRQAYRTDYAIHGRVADAFTANDRRITTLQVDGCFNEIDGIAHYQIVQRAQAPWILRFVADNGGPSPAELGRLAGRLGDLLWTDPLEVQAKDALMPEASGKFRLGYPSLPLGKANPV